jgi:hypothetical protein
MERRSVVEGAQHLNLLGQRRAKGRRRDEVSARVRKGSSRNMPAP